jgi:hypothetical protein
LRLRSGGCKGHKNIPFLVVVNVPPTVLQVIVLMSSILMNGAELFASRMMLLLSPVSARYGVNFMLAFNFLFNLDNGILGIPSCFALGGCFYPATSLMLMVISGMDDKFLVILFQSCQSHASLVLSLINYKYNHYCNCRLLLTSVILTPYLTISISSSCT